jgi:hypothetical protein
VIALLRSDDEEESKTITVRGEMQEFEEQNALETEKAFARWSENEKAKGRPEEELNFKNFMKETVIEPKQ